jgi:hypothetical protein
VLLDHLFDVLRPDGAEKKAADLIAQPGQVGGGGAAHQFSQLSVRHNGWGQI